MKPWQKKAAPSVSFGHLPFAPYIDKKVPCLICGKVGEITNKRNVENERIFKCNDCKIYYSQYLKKGFCSWGITDKNRQLLTDNASDEQIPVRVVTPSECKNCRTHTDKTKNCPFFRGMVGKELAMPEGWEKV